MKIRHAIAIRIFLTAIIFATGASAYVGPGLGAGGLGSVIGALMGLGMLVAGSIWHPIKLAIAKIKEKFKIF